MASSSSSHNINGIPVAIRLEWYKIRDTFFGQNLVDQNIPLALKLASSCQHPDARYLIEACAGKDVTTKEDGKRVLSALGQNDARALCFFWLLSDQEDEAILCSAWTRVGLRYNVVKDVRKLIARLIWE
jgi:hypothetical protein